MSLDEILDDLLNAVEEIGYSAASFRSAKSPQDLQKALTNASRFSGAFLEAGKAAEAEFISLMEQSYREAGGTGSIPRRYKDKAARVRKKYMESLQRTSADSRTWAKKKAEEAASAKISKAKDTLRSQLSEKVNQGLATKAERAQLQKLIQEARDEVKGLGDDQLGDDPQVFYRRKNKKTGKITNVPVNAQRHLMNLHRYNLGIHKNLGVIAAAEKKSGYVIVTDGAACGRTSHRDPEKVHGQVWSCDEALSYPLAHPGCQRNFFVADGPPGSKKVKDQLRGVGIKSVQKTGRQKLETAAKVATRASMVGSIAGALITNPYSKRFIRELLSDATLELPEAARRALFALTSYSKREAAALVEHGQRLGIATQEDFNDYLAHSFDEDFATAQFLQMQDAAEVKLRIEQARVLGLPTVVEKSRLLEALDDYGDWLLHRDTMILPIEERIRERRLWKEARDEIYDVAAIQYHVMRPPGLHTDRNWSKVAQAFAETYRKNPEKARLDAIRLLASVVDPTPWLKFPLPANMSFMIGMPARARENIAVKIYGKATSRWVMSAKEIEWAKQLGMNLEQLEALKIKIGRDDLISLIGPRLSWAPGPLIHATINMENGIIRPVIRAFPHGSYSRFLNLEARLGRLDVKEFIRKMERSDLPFAEKLIDALGEAADPEMITAINFFRHSPVQTTMYLNGLDPSGLALKLMPDNRFVNYSYRVMFDQKARYMNMTKDELILLGEDRGLWFSEELRKAKIIEEMVAWDKQALSGFRKAVAEGALKGKTLSEILADQPVGVAELLQQITDGWQTGLTVMPGRLFGFSLHNLDLNAQEMVIQMRLMGYSLLRISKETRFGYTELLEFFSEKRAYLYDRTLYWKNSLKNVESIAELKNLLIGTIRRPRMFEKLYDARESVDMSNIKFDLSSRTELKADLEIFNQVWGRLMPGNQAINFELSQAGDPLFYKGGTIFIRQDVADDWATWAAMRRKGVKLKWFPNDTTPGVASLFHEAAHHMLESLSPVQLANLKRRVIYSYKTWGAQATGRRAETVAEFDKWFFNPKNQEMLSYRVSAYGADSWDELIAEAFSEYMVSAKPGRIADAVGNQLLIQRPRIVAQKLTNGKLFEVTDAEWQDAITSSYYEWDEFSKTIEAFILLPTDANRKAMESFGVTESALNEYKKQIKYKKQLSYVTLKTRNGNSVEISEMILNHPLYGTNHDLINSYMDAVDSWVERYPGMKPPRLTNEPMSVDRLGLLFDPDSTNMPTTTAFVRPGENVIYIPDSTLWAQKFQEILSDDMFSGATLNGSLHSTNHSKNRTIIEHEMVHVFQHSNLSMSDNRNFLLELDRQGVMKLSAAEKKSLDDWARSADINRPTSNVLASGQTDADLDAWEGFSFEGAMSDKFVNTSVSEYGGVNPDEWFAETLSMGKEVYEEVEHLLSKNMSESDWSRVARFEGLTKKELFSLRAYYIFQEMFRSKK